ncbi:hypothetical protein [Burkholderia phage FLC6]|nr:hypothetical protein [Burkholderia phage FLC6]
MSGPNFSYINQFKRNGHAPLPKSKPEPEVEWITNGEYIDPAKVRFGTEVNPETGQWQLVQMERPSNVGKSLPSTFFTEWQKKIVDHMQVQVLGDLIKKYPRPPKGPSRFSPKNSIPRGISDKHPFGDPSIQYRGYRLLSGMPIRRIPTFPTDITIGEYKFIEAWVKSIVRTS